MALAASTFGLKIAPWLESGRNLLWPPHCPACGGSTEREEVCEKCLAALPRLFGPCCEVCSQPLPGADEGLVCQNCRDRQFHFVCSLSPMRMHGEIREMIHRLKYGRERWLARILARWMAELSEDPRLDLSSIDAIVPVPLHRVREREREFNQALLLATALGKIWNKPVRSILLRQRATETQTHFDRQRRMQNLRDAFVLVQNADVSTMNLILVDDIFTTGSTLDECARVLLDADAHAVWAVTAARA